MQRCSDAVKALGGETVVIAGDLFHVRGSIKPSVFNKALEFFGKNADMSYVLLAGNHDLETKTAEDESSALTAFCEFDNVIVANEGTVVHDTSPTFDGCGLICIPWIESIQLEDIEERLRHLSVYTESFDLILHAPIDGVFEHIPEGGLSPSGLDYLPVKRVFSGHFHNHKKLTDKVWSIGSIAQFSFGEKDNKTGFMIVYPDEVFHLESSQPKFVEKNLSELKGFDVKQVKNTFMKVNLDAKLSQEKVEAVRKVLLDKGVNGVIFQTVRESVERVDSSVEAGASLETSVTEYVGKLKNAPTGLNENCLRILSELNEWV